MSSSNAAPGSNYAPRAGFDASGASGLYHSARPDYPVDAIAAILESAQEAARGEALNIIEVGSGTGISTQSLLQITAERKRRDDRTSALQIQRYLAVDPSSGMRQDWDKNITQTLVPELASSSIFTAEQDISCLHGTFEDLSSALAGGKRGIYDLVWVAQAWHWCPDIPASLNAIAEALKPPPPPSPPSPPSASSSPGGVLALIWNMEDQSQETGSHWVKLIRELYEKHENNTPQYRHRYWTSMYKEPALLDQFEIVEPKYYSRKLPTTVQGVKDRVLSKSYISMLPVEEQESLTKSIDDVFASTDDAALQRVWIDKERGVFEYPYQTELLLFRRKK
ncbi:unnamed protein product [Parajaminaea phylloscopi]